MIAHNEKENWAQIRTNSQEACEQGHTSGNSEDVEDPSRGNPTMTNTLGPF